MLKVYWPLAKNTTMLVAPNLKAIKPSRLMALNGVFKRLFRYVFIIIKYSYVVYTSYVTKNQMNFYRVKIWDLRYQNPTQSKKKPSILRSRRTFLDPGNFAESSVFKTCRAILWFRKRILIAKPIAGHALPSLLNVQSISFRNSGMRRKQNFEIVFGFKSDTAVLTFPFRFHSTLTFSLFLFI